MRLIGTLQQLEVVFRKKSRFLLEIGGQFDTWHFVEAAFVSKNWDNRLKFCMQSPIVALYTDLEENLVSEVINLHQKSRFCLQTTSTKVHQVRAKMFLHFNIKGWHHTENLCIYWFYDFHFFLCHPNVHSECCTLY